MAKKKNIVNYETKYTNAIEAGRELVAKFKKAQNFVQTRQEDLTELMSFYQGTQYNLASYENNKPWVVQMNTPHATTIIDTRVSSLIAQDYMGILEPYSPQDKEAVDALQDILEDTWDEVGLNKQITEAIHRGAIVREGYIHITYNKNKIYGGTNRLMKGGIEVRAIDTSHVYLDPNARKFDDCDYICITERINKKKAFKKYPFLENNLVVGSSPEERGEIYQGNDYTTGQEDVLTKITFYSKEYNNDGEHFVIKRNVLIEDALVEEEKLTGLHRFPIAQFRWKSCEDSAYGLGLMDDILCLQKAVNAIESAITNTAIAYASPSFVMSRTCGVSPVAVAQASGAPGAVFVVDGDPSNAIVPLIPPKIDDKIVSIKSEFENSMNTIAGITGSYIGSLGTAGNTASSAEMAIDRAKIIETIAISNIEDFVRQITLIMCDYLITMYAGENQIFTRHRGDTDGKIEFKEHSLPQDIEDTEFSFFVDLSTRTKFSVEQQERTLKDLYQQERQYDAPIKLINELDVLEASGLRNKDYLKSRYNREVALDAEKKVELLNQITALGQKYQLPPELVQGAQVEIVQGDEKMELTNQILQMAEQVATQMEQQVEQTNDALIEQGYSPEMVQQASQDVLANGMNQQMFE